MLTLHARRLSILAHAALALVSGAGSVHAQATSQIPLQFNFMTPGARSLGMGGAFLGAADDATSASANPSGLASLTLRELSAEGRFQRIETPYLYGGRISGNMTGIGLDTAPGPVYRTDVDRQGAPAFVSLVVPLARATVAVYRHEVARMENTFFSEGVFRVGSIAGISGDSVRDLPLGGTRQIGVSSYGGAIGIRVTPRLAVGGGAALYTFTLRSSFARFNVESTAFSPPDRSFVTATAVQDGDGVSVTPNVGVVWSALTGVRIGGQFRRGPRFEFTQTDDVPLNLLHVVRTGRFKVPDVMGAGVEWRIKGRDDQAEEPAYSLRVLADYTRVRYSQLEEDFVNIQALVSNRPEQLDVDDGDEIHAGMEIALLRWRGQPITKPIFLRAGAWLDPDHAVRYTRTPLNDQIDTLMAATLPGGKDLMHYTFGGGIVLPRRVELNGAVDLSSRTTYATTSLVVRF